MLSSCCSGNSTPCGSVCGAGLFRYVSDERGQPVLLSRLHDCTPCKRMQSQVGLVPDMPVLLTLMGFLPVGFQFLVAFCRLGSSAVSLPVVQAQPLPIPYVPAQLPTRVQSRCTSHSGSTRSLHCRSQVPIWLSAPTRAFHSVSATTNRGHHHLQRLKSSPCTTMSKSGDECPNAPGQLLELGKPMSVSTF